MQADCQRDETPGHRTISPCLPPAQVQTPRPDSADQHESAEAWTGESETSDQEPDHQQLESSSKYFALTSPSVLDLFMKPEKLGIQDVMAMIVCCYK